MWQRRSALEENGAVGGVMGIGTEFWHGIDPCYLGSLGLWP